MKDTKQRAKIEILGWVTQFCLDLGWSGKARFSPRSRDVQCGDLVALTSCAFTKWYLSWVVEIEDCNGWTKYLLESIEDGSLCWWENVGLHKFVDTDIPQKWRWTDRQFQMRDQWFRACRRRDAYITLPCEPVFNQDGGVTLKTRTRHGWDDHNQEITFPDWRKVKVREMLAFYDSVVEYRKTLPPKTTLQSVTALGDGVEMVVRVAEE